MQITKAILKAFPRVRARGVRLSPAGRRYDWRPDIPDPRDMTFSSVSSLSMDLPRKVDLRSLMPPVYNQGVIGSCTGNAVMAIYERVQLEQLKVPGDSVYEFEQRYCPGSRLFLYGWAREMMGTFDQDSGAFLRDCMKVGATIGWCREDLHPYSGGYLYKRPSREAMAEAAQNRITRYARLRSLREMKQCLANGDPFVFGFMVFESFEGPEVSTTGIMKMPEPNERSLGGHAVTAVGYDDDFEFPDGSKGAMIIRNSWGSHWGGPMAGHCMMPYSYIKDPNLSDDFWCAPK